MRILFVANAVDNVTASQTTAMLLERAAVRGHAVFLCGAGDLGVGSDGRLLAWAAPIGARADRDLMLDGARRAGRVRVPLDGIDFVWVRTNPARDPRSWAHAATLDLLCLAEERGIPVLNAPSGLRKARTKLYVCDLPPEVRPETLVTRDPSAVRAFLEQLGGPAVIKPMSGTQGRDVFRVSLESQNLRQITEVVTREGYAMVQRYVPDAEAGDVRLILVDGKPLVVKNRIAAVHRVPGNGDFRSNIAAGGTAQPAVLTDGQRRTADIVGARLRADGLWLTGLDLIGDKVVEVNVFSTGGLRDAERFTGASFTDAIVDAAERKVRG